MSGIRSFDRDDLPEDWKRLPERRVYIALGTLSVFLLVSLAVAALEFADGESGRGVGALAFAGLWLIIIVIGIDGRLRPWASTSAPYLAARSAGKPAVILPYSRIQFAGYMVVMVYVGLVLLVAGFVVNRGESLLTGGMILFVLFALLFWSFPVLVAFGKFRRGWLALTPDGVYQRGWTFESYLPWSSIIVVLPSGAGPEVSLSARQHDPGWQGKQFTKLWRQDRIPRETLELGHPRMNIPAKDIGVDLRLVYNLLLYYQQNPESRSELGTQIGLERVRQLSSG